MAEFDEKLNALLSNPASMAQILELARSLSGETAAGSTPGTAPEGPGESAPGTVSDGPPDSGGAAGTGGPGTGGGSSPPDFQSVLGGLDPKLLSRLLPLLQEFQSGQNREARQLLTALRPYLKQERQEKVDRALQLARLIHLGKRFLTNWEG